MQGDGCLGLVALGEVVALQDAGDGELARDGQQLLQAHGEHPVAVMDDGGLLGVQDLHGLGDVGLRVGLDLLLGKLRTGSVLAGRIADGGGAVADDQGHAMAQVLELAHLAQRHGVAQVQVRAGGVDAQLDVQGLALLKLLLEVALGHDLRRAGGDDSHLLVNWQQDSVLLLNRIAPSPGILAKGDSRPAAVLEYTICLV